MAVRQRREWWRRLAARPALWLAVCGLWLMVFCLPFLAKPGDFSSGGIYLYFFGAWALLIILIFFIAMGAADSKGESGADT